MQAFTDQRQAETPDEIWLLQHHPVFTQGQAGKPEHLLNPGDIPVVKSDRGGQVTYHGPGQLMAYLLLDLRRKKLGVRDVVSLMEEAVIALLADHGQVAVARADAPGVYVDGCKIASLGLRVRRGCSFHGLALNVDMDLQPFTRINPCGYAGLQMTQLRNLCPDADIDSATKNLLNYLVKRLDYSQVELANHLES
ncbi:lipoyl(octanoyl) transferase LipB [Nitrincola sp. A-D6]|uniref:lipoyl(octanoyl) transferase LipB n=1 Tax=Nitrincola sp. A-D6 TaxID=1545442 RepID=UPI0009DEA16D|nr:lipoyl(octanoyl) transferase LipB [Nitrincola sp. A-D6]